VTTAIQQTFYEILGVRYEATAEEIRTAFRRLARAHHPDRFAGASRIEAEKAFQAITEAYNVLIDSDARARYDQGIARPATDARPSRRELARALLGKALTLMRSDDNREAGDLLAQAVAHDPDYAKARHSYGVFLAQVGKLEEGLRHLDQAARLDPLNLRILLDASKFFAKARMYARATRLANSAAELAPDDPAVESWRGQLEGMAKRGDGASS